MILKIITHCLVIKMIYKVVTLVKKNKRIWQILSDKIISLLPIRNFLIYNLDHKTKIKSIKIPLIKFKKIMKNTYFQIKLLIKRAFKIYKAKKGS